MRPNVLLRALALAACCCWTAAAAQTGRSAQAAPTPFDSFGDILLTDWHARLDAFAVELQQTPSSRGYVVAYPERAQFPGWPFRRSSQALRYLTEACAIAAERLAIVNGGYRDRVTFELWVIGDGAALPFAPFDFALMLAGEKTPFPFDRFPVIERGDADEYAAEDAYLYRPDSAWLYGPFVSLLNQDTGLRGCVVGYVSNRRARGADRKLAERVKAAMLKAYPLDVRRVAAVGGGRRDQKTVELWIVPPGSPLPGPAPDPPPARRRRRARR